MDCFSNYDCPDLADRCENKGTVDLPVPCCVPGKRGSVGLGQPCMGENDCASALCLDTGMALICTEKCTTKAMCIPALSKCATIAFSGSNLKFCIP